MNVFTLVILAATIITGLVGFAVVGTIGALVSSSFFGLGLQLVTAILAKPFGICG